MTANERQVGGAHYKTAYEHWDLVSDLRLSYFEGQITKYVSRARKKNGAQDLEKALHFTEKLYEVYTRGKTAPSGRQRGNFIAEQVARFAAVNELNSLEHATVCAACTWHGATDLRDLQRRILGLLDACAPLKEFVPPAYDPMTAEPLGGGPADGAYVDQDSKPATRLGWVEEKKS